MAGRTLYEILGVDTNAPTDVIRRVFRQQAQKLHPDRNANDPEAAARFCLAHHAYTVLCDPQARRRYDHYVATSCVFSGTSRQTGRPRSGTRRPALDSGAGAARESLDHLNYILWEVEDRLRSTIGTAQEANLLAILELIDSEVLVPAGYPDYFFQARGMEQTGPTAHRYVRSDRNRDGHGPYSGSSDYFYDVRRRSDRFMSGVRPADLHKPLGDTGRPLIDVILEAHARATDMLAELS